MLRLPRRNIVPGVRAEGLRQHVRVNLPSVLHVASRPAGPRRTPQDPTDPQAGSQESPALKSASAAGVLFRRFPLHPQPLDGATRRWRGPIPLE